VTLQAVYLSSLSLTKPPMLTSLMR